MEKKGARRSSLLQMLEDSVTGTDEYKVCAVRVESAGVA